MVQANQARSEGERGVFQVGALRIWFLGLTASAFGAWLGWIGGETAATYLRWDPSALDSDFRERGLRDSEITDLLFASRVRAETKNTALTFGILGGSIGLSFGLIGSLGGHMRRCSVLGGMGGLILGFVAGVSISIVLVPLFFARLEDGPSPVLPVLMHIGMYSTIGAVAGFSFGFGLSRWRGAGQGLVAGFMGALLGAFVNDVLHTILFPLEWEYSPIPGTGSSRLMGHLLVSLLAMICSVAVLSGRVQNHHTAKESTVQAKSPHVQLED